MAIATEMPVPSSPTPSPSEEQAKHRVTPSREASSGPAEDISGKQCKVCRETPTACKKERGCVPGTPSPSELPFSPPAHHTPGIPGFVPAKSASQSQSSRWAGPGIPKVPKTPCPPCGPAGPMPMPWAGPMPFQPFSQVPYQDLRVPYHPFGPAGPPPLCTARTPRGPPPGQVLQPATPDPFGQMFANGAGFAVTPLPPQMGPGFTVVPGVGVRVPPVTLPVPGTPFTQGQQV